MHKLFGGAGVYLFRIPSTFDFEESFSELGEALEVNGHMNKGNKGRGTTLHSFSFPKHFCLKEVCYKLG